MNSTPTALIRLILIDDHRLVRDAWAYFLNYDGRFSVIAQAGRAEEGITLCKDLRPDIVLLDINLPDMSGIDAVPLIRKFAPAVKILGVSLHTQVCFAKSMIHAGASGYITKNSSKEEMTIALLEISEGKKYLCEEIKNALTETIISHRNEPNINALSMREMEIVELVRQGQSSKEIALVKSISVKTVEVHRYNILKKLHLSNAAALVDYINRVDN